MTEPFGEVPLTDEGRLDSRRIQATVLERRAEFRRRRWRIVASAVLVVSGIQTAIYTIDFARQSAVKPALSTGLLTALLLLFPTWIIRQGFSTGRSAPSAPLGEPDFTDLGDTTSFAERLEQVRDDDDV